MLGVLHEMSWSYAPLPALSRAPSLVSPHFLNAVFLCPDEDSVLPGRPPSRYRMLFLFLGMMTYLKGPVYIKLWDDRDNNRIKQCEQFRGSFLFTFCPLFCLSVFIFSNLTVPAWMFLPTSPQPAAALLPWLHSVFSFLMGCPLLQ